MAVLALMLASGFAGLGYQLVWTQQAGLYLGHESTAVLAVITAFFGGLALGAWMLASRIERSARPERWYAGCEVTIALWSLVLATSMPAVSRWLLDLTGAQPSAAWQWTVAFGGTFVLLLPATAAMGATLPAMERVTAARHLPSRSIAALYAANTFGAVLGVLATACWLVPAIGLLRTAGLCALLNLVCGATALRLVPIKPLPVAAATVVTSADARRLQGLLAATGLLGIGYEVLVVRVLSQVSENTVFTFAILLAIYLVGTALGAAARQRGLLVNPAGDPAALRDRLLQALATACLLGSLSLWGAEALRDAVQRGLGQGMGSALAAEAVPACAAFALPTLLMGALFSELALAARASGVAFGRALAVNTLGAAAAPLLFGLVLAPLLGAKGGLLLVVAGYLALPLLCATHTSRTSRTWHIGHLGHIGRSWHAPATLVLGAALLATAVMLAPLTFVDVPPGGRVISYQDGAMAAVSVVEDAEGVARLRINNRQQEGSSSSLLADSRQALLPLLLHPAPQRALFLGLGTGMTARSAAQDPTLRVDAVELLPEVITASAHFAQAFDGSAAHGQLQLLAADARRFVRAAGPAYDVIVADNYHPARSGSAALYTVEHFTAVRERLAAGGLFCQWLPLHQLDLQTLRSIVQSFLAAYPQGLAVLATNSLETPVLGLVGRADRLQVDRPGLRQRLADPTQQARRAAAGFPDDLALLGSFVAGPQALRRWAGDAPVNTDDRPLVAYLAPRITYVPDTLPRERLFSLLRQLSVAPDDLVADAGHDPVWAARLAAYWAARNQFLDAGRNVQPMANPRDMLAQVRAPLRAVLQTSPDFRPAYDPLLRMAAALGRSDPAAARALLVELVQHAPQRTEAGALLQQRPATQP